MWKEYMAEERAKEKKPRLDEYRHHIAMVKFVENQRAKNANFGTVHHMSKRDDMLAPKDFNVYSRAGVK